MSHLRDQETADYFNMIGNNLRNEFSESMQNASVFFQGFGEFLVNFLQKLLELLSALSAAQ